MVFGVGQSKQAHLNVSVQIPELLQVGESLDAPPARVGEEVHWTEDVGGNREPQQKVQLPRVNLAVLQQNLGGADGNMVINSQCEVCVV